MRYKGHFLLQCLLVITLVGCVVGRGPELRFPTGRVHLPEAEQWEMGHLPQTSTASRLLSPTHTVVAKVVYQEADTNILAFMYQAQSHRHEILEQLVVKIRNEYSEGRYKLLSFESNPITLKNADCFDYRVESEDLEFPEDKGTPYPFRARGRFCIFTDRLIALRLEYSERRAASEQPYARFDDEAQDFIQEIVFE